MLITIKELALELGIDRSNLRRFVIKNGINMTRTRTADSRNQLTLALTAEDAETVRELRQSQGFTQGYAERAAVSNGVGYFYIVQVIPEFDSNRIKFGYTENLQARLSTHRTSAPTAELLKSWPARKHWEAVAIESITRTGCKNIANEVFECDSLEALLERASDFFALMPELETQSKARQGLTNT